MRGGWRRGALIVARFTSCTLTRVVLLVVLVPAPSAFSRLKSICFVHISHISIEQRLGQLMYPHGNMISLRSPSQRTCSGCVCAPNDLALLEIGLFSTFFLSFVLNMTCVTMHTSYERSSMHSTSMPRIMHTTYSMHTLCVVRVVVLESMHNIYVLKYP